MPYYPLFIDLSCKTVLVVGAGGVGQRKINTISRAGPRMVVVVDPALDQDRVAVLEASGAVQCHAREFRTDDLDGKTLVFAATDKPEVNRRIARMCEARGILCNRADQGEERSGFIVPASFSKEGVTVALSTCGQSPALAKVLREDLEAFVGKRYTILLPLLARLRPALLAERMPTRDNTAIFRAIVHSPLAEHLERDDREAAGELLRSLLPENLHRQVGALVHGL